MLIPSPRHTPDDLAAWAEWEAADRASHSANRADAAAGVVGRFLADGRAYCAVSWGKDSTALADVVLRVDSGVPLVWVRVVPIANPDCVAVRDAFLAAHPDANYHEIEVSCTWGGGTWHATGTLETGFRRAVERFGPRRLSGVRAAESAQRAISARVHGTGTGVSCRPLLRWSAGDVFAYLEWRALPVHSAYAMTGGGRWDRSRLRVSSLGGRRGDGAGRAEWEREYYGDVLRRLACGPSSSTKGPS